MRHPPTALKLFPPVPNIDPGDRHSLLTMSDDSLNHVFSVIRQREDPSTARLTCYPSPHDENISTWHGHGHDIDIEAASRRRNRTVWREHAFAVRRFALVVDNVDTHLVLSATSFRKRDRDALRGIGHGQFGGFYLPSAK